MLLLKRGLRIHLHSRKEALDVSTVALGVGGTYACFLLWELLMAKEHGAATQGGWRPPWRQPPSPRQSLAAGF